MKTIYKLLGLFVVVFTLGACNPVEDRKTLSNTFNPENIELQVTQTADGTGNGIELKMNTPGVFGYWDYKIGKKYTDNVKFIFPYPGEITFEYHITSMHIDGALKDVKRDEIVKKVNVTISKLDQPIDEPYYALVGKNLEGKTWVFNRKAEHWWYMCPGNDVSKCMGECWWDAGNTPGCEPSDYLGKMVFDLDGGANFTHYETEDATPTKGGSFGFNSDFTKLLISGEKKILGNTPDRGNAAGEFEIFKLTDDEMVLYVPNNEGGTGWAWVFKPLK